MVSYMVLPCIPLYQKAISEQEFVPRSICRSILCSAVFHSDALKVLDYILVADNLKSRCNATHYSAATQHCTELPYRFQEFTTGTIENCVTVRSIDWL